MPFAVGRYVCTDECVGHGATGTVYRGYCRSTMEPVAIKVVSLGSGQVHQKYLLQERAILRRLNHPNIVKLYDEVEMKNQLCLVMEMMSGGQLYELIGRRGPMPECLARKFLCQLASGLKYLNDEGVVHRDLKPHNLLLTCSSEDATLKIADFGFARLSSSLMQTRLGSPLYMAPELLLMSGVTTYSAKSDMWSVGVIFWEMLSGSRPWSEAGDNEARLHALVSNRDLVIPDHVSKASRRVLMGLLEKDPDKRMSIEALCSSSYVMQPRGGGPVSAATSWLQEIVSLESGASQSLYVTPGILVASLKERLARIWGGGAAAADSDDVSGGGADKASSRHATDDGAPPPHISSPPFLLVDPTGAELENPYSLSYYTLHLRSSPLYCVSWQFLACGEPYPCPSSNVSAFPVPPAPPSDSVRSRIRAAVAAQETIAISAEGTRKALASAYQWMIAGGVLQQRAWKAVCSYIYLRRNQSWNLYRGIFRSEDVLCRQARYRALHLEITTYVLDKFDADSKLRIDRRAILADLQAMLNDVSYLEMLASLFRELEAASSSRLESSLDGVLLSWPSAQVQATAADLSAVGTSLIQSAHRAESEVQGLSAQFRRMTWHRMSPDEGETARDGDDGWEMLGPTPKDVEGLASLALLRALHSAEAAIASFAAEQRRATEVLIESLGLRQKIQGMFSKALSATKPLRDKTEAFRRRLDEETRTRITEADRRAAHLADLTKLPDAHRAASEELARRRAWFARIARELEAIVHDVEARCLEERAVREAYKAGVHQSMAYMLDGAFPDLGFLRGDDVVAHNEHPPLVSAAVTNEFVEFALRYRSRDLGLSLEAMPTEGAGGSPDLVARCLTLTDALKASEARIQRLHRDLQDAEAKLAVGSRDAEIVELKRNIEWLHRHGVSSTKRENQHLRAQLEQKNETIRKIREDFKDAENLVNQLIRERSEARLRTIVPDALEEGSQGAGAGIL